MQEATQKRWSTGTREKITDISKGVSEILAGLAEPLMRYSTVYLALATSIKIIYYAPAYSICEGIVIAAPEFVLLGAFTIAENAIKDGQKKWGCVLFTICLLLAGIMVATFVDIFIFPFPDTAIRVLNFARCLVALGFSIALGKLEKTREAAGTEATFQSQPAPALPTTTYESHLEPEPAAPAEPEATRRSHMRKPQNKAAQKGTESQEEKLEEAYQQLLRAGSRISGRALVPLAHVSRATANKWLETKAGATSEGQSHPAPIKITEARARQNGNHREAGA